MFDIIRNNRGVVQILLALIVVPFAFFGVESYFHSFGSGDHIATVGDTTITAQQFREAMLEQQNMLRNSAQGRQIPPKMLDSPDMRRAVLERLISKQLIADYAHKAHFSISDDQLSQFIASVPSLQVDGKFSQENYDALVASQNLTKAGFEAKLRRDIILQQAAGGLASSAIAGKSPASLWEKALLEEREIATVELKPEQFLAQVNLAADAAQKYYDSHQKEFEVPPQVKAEFVIFSLGTLINQTVIQETEIKAAYDANPTRFKQGEERRASHILINAAKSAPEADVKQAKAKAENLLAQLRKNPKDFARLAKANSQDTGSAAKGGDLEWFGRGAMTPPFEAAAFGLKENEISGLVRSDYGFHIIQVTGVRGEKSKTLAEARGEIEGELKRQAATKKYAQVAEEFTDVVFTQADSLKPAADKYKLDIQKSDWIARGSTGTGLASNPKLMAALFSDDAIKNKHNTATIEVAPNTLVAAHVTEAKPASMKPFADVKAVIDKQLGIEQARKIVIKEGEARLAKLKKGDAGNSPWSEPRHIARLGAEKMPRETVATIFKTPVTTLPAYGGVANPDGSYSLFRISQVIPFAGADNDQRSKALQQQYAQLVSGEEFSAWVSALREKAGVEINQKALETKQESE